MSDQTTRTLWAVVGATGTGKTALSLDLAEALAARGRRAEIVNADAMQLYRGMDIGTGKLPYDRRCGIPHHLLDVLDPTEEASVARYQDAARRTIAEVHACGADAILVGGSGLYVSSVLFDLRFPPRDADLRARLEAELAEQGAEALYARLRDVDPATAARIDSRNGRRIVRALEVLAQDGASHGGELSDDLGHWHPDTRIVALHTDRDRLVRVLDDRVVTMWASGMLDEVARLRDAGIERGVTASRAIGYAQALAQLRGDVDAAEAVAQTQQLTRRYARRQVSWFRRYRDAFWVTTTDDAMRLLRLRPLLDDGGGDDPPKQRISGRRPP